LSAKLAKLVKLDHLFTLTDDNAVVQHARFSVPYKKEGYAVDDSARALVFAAKASRFWDDVRLDGLQTKLLTFLLTMQEEDGRFHNLMDFSHQIIDKASTGDHLGRALWAAAAVMSSKASRGMKRSARLIFDRALPHASQSNWLRTKAYACLALHERLKEDPNDTNLRSTIARISNDLSNVYSANKRPDWLWFEDQLTYDNPRLSQALFRSYQCLKQESLLTDAEESLKFLHRNELQGQTFVPIGNSGWLVKGAEKAFFDQQPIEPGAMMETSAIAHYLTKTPLYENMAKQALFWFLGENLKRVKVYDESTGACYDGINKFGLNENQGAESTIAFLLGAYELLACVNP